MEPVVRRLRDLPWRRRADGAVELNHGGAWHAYQAWTAAVLEGLDRDEALGAIIGRAEAAGLADAGARVRTFLFGLHAEGFVEIGDAPAPEVFEGRWARVRELGRGGVAVAWLARDRRDGRLVVVKRPWDFLVPLERASLAVRRESELLAAFDHPGVVRRVAEFEADGRLHLVRDYLEGDDLFALRRKGPVARAELLGIAEGVAEAVAHVHARGYLLLDVSPGNFVLAGRRPVLLDVGTCREHEGGEIVLRHRAGSPKFMAPETRRGRRASVRSDVYGFGLLLHFLATGVLARRDEPLAAQRPQAADADVREAIHRLVREDPGERPASMEEAREIVQALGKDA